MEKSPKNKMTAFITDLNGAFRFEKFTDFNHSLFGNDDAAVQFDVNILFKRIIDLRKSAAVGRYHTDHISIVSLYFFKKDPDNMGTFII